MNLGLPNTPLSGTGAEGTRSRIISFRVSDAEYAEIGAVSASYGFDSVSLFARSATVTCRTFEPRKNALGIDLHRLLLRLELLGSALDSIAAQLSKIAISL